MGGQQSNTRNPSRHAKSSSRPSTSYDDHRPPGRYLNNQQFQTPNNNQLKFHRTHGKNITLKQNKNVAERTFSFCYGIVFSDRPIGIGEKVHIKLSSIHEIWSGVMRIGLTRNNPENLVGDELPRYACPDLTNKPGFWAKAIPEDLAVENNIFTISVKQNSIKGDLEYSVNGEPHGTLFSGVDTTCPLWVMLDIYGNTISLEFVDESKFSQIPESQLVPELEEAPQLSVREAFSIPMTEEIAEIKFSAVCGSAVDISNDKFTCFKQVTRKIFSYTVLHPSSIGFTDLPLTPGDTWYLRVQSKNYCDGGHDLGVGVTSVNPSSLTPEEFPEDSEDLIDRSEYWIINKMLKFPNEGEYFSISMGFDGNVTRKLQDGNEISLFFVDTSRPLWLIVDLCGNINSVLSVGCTVSENPNPRWHYESADLILSQHVFNNYEIREEVDVAPVHNIQDLSLEDTDSSDDQNFMRRGVLHQQDSSSSSSSSSESDNMEVIDEPNSEDQGSSSRGILGAIAGGILFGVSTGIARSLLRSRSNSANENAGNYVENSDFEFENAEIEIENAENNIENAGMQLEDAEIEIENPDTSGDEYQTPEPENNIEPSGDRQSLAVFLSSRIEQPPIVEVTNVSDPNEPSTSVIRPSISSVNEISLQVTECVICFDMEPNMALYDCGHKCLCETCATKIHKQRFPKCPVCRKPIKDILRIYA